MLAGRFWWIFSVSATARWGRAKMIWRVERKNDMQQHHKLPGCARHTSFNKACEKAGNTNSLRRLADAQMHPLHIHLTMFEAVFFSIINIPIWTPVTYFNSLLIHLNVAFKAPVRALVALGPSFFYSACWMLRRQQRSDIDDKPAYWWQ